MLGSRSLELELAFRQYGPETESLRQMMKASVQEAYEAAQGNRKAYEQHFEIGGYLSKFEKWNDTLASLIPRTPLRAFCFTRRPTKSCRGVIASRPVGRSKLPPQPSHR